MFRPVARTPDNVKPVGYKWVFVRKRNEKNKVVRYKARLVAQGFSQRPGIDYDETYSPVMDTITFRFLISMAVSEKFRNASYGRCDGLPLWFIGFRYIHENSRGIQNA